jgi:hypothetical protein
MREAGRRCLAGDAPTADRITAADLLANCDAPDATAENIEQADWWCNRPGSPLAEFMSAYDRPQRP